MTFAFIGGSSVEQPPTDVGAEKFQGGLPRLRCGLPASVDCCAARRCSINENANGQGVDNLWKGALAAVYRGQ
jgi:hypothetical protein